MCRTRPLPAVPSPFLLLAAQVLATPLLAPLLAQQPKAAPAFPERDILSPFRTCTEIHAAPDELFARLRQMRDIAEDPLAHREFDAEGREKVDDARWQAARREVDRIGVDAGVLAQIMRVCRDADERALAFYGAFYCRDVDHVFNLIAHIPGEPVRTTRERAFPRAIAFLRAHLGRRWGDLSPEERAAIEVPAPGSPAGKALGITRAPRDQDPLHQINLKPFLQLLDLDDADDRAQGLWFVKEVLLVRPDLALTWLEPALPRIRELLVAKAPQVRREAEGLLLAIGPKGLTPPPQDADDRQRDEFAERAIRHMFPPIRDLSDGLMVLLPSPERAAIVAAGREALAGKSLGEPQSGRTKDGVPYRGFRVAHVPEALAVLRIPAGAVITSINGAPVDDAASLLRVLEGQFEARDGKGNVHPVSRRTLIVEFVLDGATKAMEYRVL